MDELEKQDQAAVAVKDSKGLESSPAEPETPRKVKGFSDLPSPSRRVFQFSRDNQKFEIEYTPLTYAQIEEIRASLLPPKPPMRPVPGLEGLKAKDLYQRKMLGLPTHEPDDDDPEYKAALVKYNNDLKIEQLRNALGWDVPREEFLAEIRRRLYPGELVALMDEVDSQAWNINSSLVENFFEKWSQLTEGESDSPRSGSA